MTPVLGRCQTCWITWTAQDVALWCRYVGCPKTEQRSPTDKQVAQFKINEPFVVQK